MKIQYQKPAKSDAGAIFELFQKMKNDRHFVSFSSAVHPDEIAAWLEESENDFYIAKSNEQAVGVLRTVRGIGNTSHSCEITIAVSPEFRDQGVAKSLLLYGLADMKTSGVTVARAFVFSDNKASLNMLLAIGFSITGSIIKHHYQPKLARYVDDVILSKEL
jgi:ribosomal protein S18 acetylase RimI-like enzyme